MTEDITWPPRFQSKKTVSPRLSWIAPSEKNREAVEKLNERSLMLEQMELDIYNMTLELMHEGFSHEEAKDKAEVAIDPENILKPWLNL